MAINKNQGKTIILGSFIILAIVLLIAIILPLCNLSSETNTIAIIPIEGEIDYNSNINNGSNFTKRDSIENNFNQANSDNNVKAIVLDINSNGGSLVASEELSYIIKNSKKPVISYIGDRGVSESYLIATSADLIVATPSSAIGGIGISFFNSSKYSNTKVSGEYENTQKYTNFSNNSQIAKSQEMIKQTNPQIANSQEMINQDYTYFLSLIGENRNLNMTYVSEIAHGKIFNGKEGLNLKLIDKLGNKEDAIKLAASQANITDYNIIEYNDKHLSNQNNNNNNNNNNKYPINSENKKNNTLSFINNIKNSLIKASD